jgi:glycosyltransferase involved in cell wall biosynthesis
MTENRAVVWHLIDANADTAYFRALARLHDRSRYPVAIGSVAPAGPLQDAMRALGVPTFSLEASGRPSYAGALRRLVRLLRAGRDRLLHAHCFDPTWLGLFAARISRRPFVFTRHHSDHHLRLGRPWHTRVDAWCARSADAVIAVSEATRTVLHEQEGVRRAVDVVYNGIEGLSEPGPTELQHLRESLDVQGHLCVVPARLHEEKGHAVLFAALPRVIERVGRVTIALAGEGPHRAELEALARQGGVSDSVRFLGHRADVAALLALADVVVLPSLAESFGLAALEAMSAGQPVVAAATGGLPEVVRDQECGLIVPPGQAEPLAEAMAAVLGNPALGRRLGEAGRSRAARFSAESMVRGYEAVYDRLLSGRASRE